MTEEQGMLRHERKHAFEKFVDISEMLQSSSSAKIAWCSNFTITVFSLHSACLLPLLP